MCNYVMVVKKIVYYSKFHLTMFKWKYNYKYKHNPYMYFQELQLLTALCYYDTCCPFIGIPSSHFALHMCLYRNS